MKRIIASVLAVSAIAAAAPATAQVIIKDAPGDPVAVMKEAPDYDPDDAYVYSEAPVYRGYVQWQGVADRLEAIDRRIDTAVVHGEITRNQALRLRDDLRAVSRLEAEWGADGLSDSEMADLDERVERLAVRVGM